MVKLAAESQKVVEKDDATGASVAALPKPLLNSKRYSVTPDTLIDESDSEKYELTVLCKSLLVK